MTHDVLQLREALEREAADVGSAAELRARLTERRPRRRPAAWLLAAASVAVVLAVAGTVLVLRPHERAVTALGGSVAWRPLDAQADRSTVPHVAAPAVPAGTPACRTSDFRLVAHDTELDGAQRRGWTHTSVLLRSTRHGACFVDRNHRPVRVAMVDASGAPLPDDVAYVLPLLAPDRRLVRPGDYLATGAHWSRVAGRANDPVALVFRIGGGDGSLRIPLGHWAIPARPIDMAANALFRAGAFVDPIAITAPGSLASLQADVQVPARIHAGDRLRYTIRLVNRTDRDVRLERCPTVLQQLSVNINPPVGLRSRLDCHAPSVLRRGEDVTFAFELAVPDARAGNGTLAWSLLVGHAAVLQVRTDLLVTR